jgi:hypothetical protein
MRDRKNQAKSKHPEPFCSIQFTEEQLITMNEGVMIRFAADYYSMLHPQLKESAIANDLHIPKATFANYRRGNGSLNLKQLELLYLITKCELVKKWVAVTTSWSREE